MKQICISLVCLLGAVSACSESKGGEKLDIGDRKTSVLGEKLTDYSGTWDGYAEAYQFESGSDRVRVVLDGSGHGTIEFGDSPLLATPTDPQVGFPPFNYDLDNQGVMPIREGFKYTVAAASLEGLRFRFDVDEGEIISGWCAMQTPYPVVTKEWVDAGGGTHIDGYFCSPQGSKVESINAAHHPETCSAWDGEGSSGTHAIDCDWMQRCSGVYSHCLCDATSCSPNPSFGTSKLDSALENQGASLVGTLVFQGQLARNRVNVRLNRKE